jgi:predicted ester cyclase
MGCVVTVGTLKPGKISLRGALEVMLMGTVKVIPGRTAEVEGMVAVAERVVDRSEFDSTTLVVVVMLEVGGLWVGVFEAGVLEFANLPTGELS